MVINTVQIVPSAPILLFARKTVVYKNKIEAIITIYHFIDDVGALNIFYFSKKLISLFSQFVFNWKYPPTTIPKEKIKQFCEIIINVVILLSFHKFFNRIN